MAKNYHLVKGKLTKRADSMLADFKRSGGKIKWGDIKNRDVQSGTFTDPDGNVYDVSYSIDDAKAAGVYNNKADSPWQKTPAAMMRARLVSETLRAIAPEIVTGVYTPEEAAQFDDVQPEPKPAQSEPVQAQPVIEAETVEDAEKNTTQKLERLIFDAKAEEQVNKYFEIKGAIDQLIEQTWRNLPAAKLQHLHDNWESFKSAVLTK
jgi:hypothetical protein